MRCRELVPALVLVVACGCAEVVDGPATLEGEVRGYEGGALDGVILSVGRKFATTSNGGRFVLTGLPSGPIEILATLNGYDDVKHPVTLGAGINTTSIVMQRKSSGAYIDSIKLQYPTSPVILTGPGSIRIGTTVYFGNPNFGWPVDTGPIAISPTGPLSATWELGARGWRALVVKASAPGSGTVTVSYKDKQATIAITAVDLEFRKLSLSSGYGCALTVADLAWCWGGNFNGPLGAYTLGKCNGSACQYGGNDGNPTPLPVGTSVGFTQVATSGYACYEGFAFGICGRTCALTAAGEAWCWGQGFGVAPKRAALGRTLRSLAMHPAALSSPSSPNTSCGIATDDKAYCFDATTATVVADGMAIKAFATGIAHSCAIDLSGDAYCWGSNVRANLGIGTADTVTRLSPVRVATQAKLTTIGVGRTSTCALDTTGRVLCWGYAGTQSAQSLCAESDPDCVLTPTPVVGGGTYLSLAKADAGPELCAVRSDGAVDCWTKPTASPVTLALPEPVVSLAVASSTASLGLPSKSCAVIQTGAIYCWSSTTSPAKFP
jgi:hypothetical protein